MTVAHHPSDLTLADFAAGHLDEGRTLVVATHLSTCAACRKAVRAFEYLRGIALEDSEQDLVAAGALQHALGVISSEQPPQQAITADKRRREAAAPLSYYPLGPWRWIGSGLRWRSVGMPMEQGTRVFMLRATPGTRIPRHGHSGIEWTSILQGAFRHQYGHYGAGDFDEADDSITHAPVIEGGEDCICLVALQGRIQFTSVIGRMMQPFVRI